MINFFENLPAKNEVKNINPQVLAFVGDAVHTLYVRTILSCKKMTKSNALHKISASFVNATNQSSIIEKIMPLLTEEEIAIFKRARNYKTKTSAKHASVIDYKRSTGFEALLGYLYLINEEDRLKQILEIATQLNEE